MFSFQNKKSCDELVFHQIPSSISFQQQQQAARYQQQAADLLVVELHDHVTMEAINNTNTNTSVFAKARKRHADQSPNNSSKPNSALNTSDPPQAGVVLVDDDQHTQRKLAHRETERQRRQDMSKLYASLRGLLPLEFVKGRRSTSDHMHQAVKYIKHMQENLRLLSLKRDQLKKFVDTTSFPPPPAAADCTDTTNVEEEKRSLLRNLNTVTISSCCNNNNNNSREIQILINSCLIEDGFPLSGVLKAISEQGLCVITCTCTKLNGRLFHSIQSQLQLQKKIPNQLVNDHPEVLPPTDLTVLQQRLTAVANNY